MKRLLLTNWHAMRWLILDCFNTTSDTIPTGNILYGCFFFASFNTGCALNGCEVSTLKKIKNE
jgi:hypothetical protein